jgi:hypothetical protein
LGGEAKAWAERLLEKLARRRRKDCARCAAQERTGSSVGATRAEADRDVDRDDLDFGKLGEVASDGYQEMV